MAKTVGKKAAKRTPKILFESDAELEESLDDSSETREKITSDAAIEQAYVNLSFRVIYQSNNYFLPQIRDLINAREVINLRPEYQRRLRWSRKQKSLLVESLLLNIPVPPIFLFESDLARYELMDGQQRLNAIHEYLGNDYALTGLDKLHFLNGKRYSNLPPKLRRGLDRASIGAIVLLRETKGDEADPHLVRRYVFERLNTGGRPLNPQEMRNSIFRGEFNELIIKLARNNTFCRMFGIPEYTATDESEYYEDPERQKNNLYRTMGDCQIVLRFFALVDDDYIRGSMRNILDACMKRHQEADSSTLEIYKTQFEKLLDACEAIFQDEAFLLLPDENGNRRVSIALYDATMVALYRRKENLDQFVKKGEAVKAGVEKLLASKGEVLTGKANTAQSIKDRIHMLGTVLDAV